MQIILGTQDLEDLKGGLCGEQAFQVFWIGKVTLLEFYCLIPAISAREG